MLTETRGVILLPKVTLEAELVHQAEHVPIARMVAMHVVMLHLLLAAPNREMPEAVQGVDSARIRHHAKVLLQVAAEAIPVVIAEHIPPLQAGLQGTAEATPPAEVQVEVPALLAPQAEVRGPLPVEAHAPVEEAEAQAEDVN